MALSWRTSVLADRHRALGSKLEDWNGMGTAWTYAKDVAQDHVAIRTKDDEQTLTWGRLRERVDALAGGLAKLGVERGDTVALMLANRPEFHIADLAVMMLGGTPFSIYQTYAVVQSSLFGKMLVLDGDTQSAALDEFIYHEALVHPACAHAGAPKRCYVPGASYVSDGASPVRSLLPGAPRQALRALYSSVRPGTGFRCRARP